MQLFFRTINLNILIFLCAHAILMGAACSSSDDTPSITVFAAASLQEPLMDIADEYSARNDIKAYLNLGGSTSLANQIIRGAPADIFISAGRASTGTLLARGIVESQQVNPWLTNEMLMVTGKPNRFIDRGIEIVLDTTVAIADPELAPAGQYARECINSFGMWDQIEHSVVRAPNVRAALAFVETGSADLAFIYRTDLQLSGTVEKVLQCPEGSHSSIEYLVSLVSSGESVQHGMDFIKFLNSEYAVGIMGNYGFTVIEQSE